MPGIHPQMTWSAEGQQSAIVIAVLHMRHGQRQLMGVEGLPRASALLPTLLTLPIGGILYCERDFSPIFRVF